MRTKSLSIACIFLFQSFVFQIFANGKVFFVNDSIAFDTLTTRIIENESSKEIVKATDFIVPTALFTYGLISFKSNGIKDFDLTLRDKIRTKHPDFKTNLDDFSIFVPGATVFLLNAVGIEGKHHWKDATLIYGGSLAITGGINLPLKYITQRERPDASKLTSFPSQHTAIAFASAEFLRREYKDVSPWIGVAGYAVATVSGALRMYNNRHWFSDVVAGAGVGIASTTLSYFIYEKLNIKIGNWCCHAVPTYTQENIGFSFVAVF